MSRKKLTVNTTSEELQLWKEAAWRQKTTLSEWVRHVLTTQAQGPPITVLNFDSGQVTRETTFTTAGTTATREGIGQPLDVQGLPLDASKGKAESRRKPRSKPCEHRLPPEVFCKHCDR